MSAYISTVSTPFMRPVTSLVSLFSLSFLSIAGSCLLSLYLSYIVRFFPFASLQPRFSLLLYYITAYCTCILYIDIFKCILYISPPFASLASSVDLLQLFHLCAVKYRSCYTKFQSHLTLIIQLTAITPLNFIINLFLFAVPKIIILK